MLSVNLSPIRASACLKLLPLFIPRTCIKAAVSFSKSSKGSILAQLLNGTVDVPRPCDLVAVLMCMYVHQFLFLKAAEIRVRCIVVTLLEGFSWF